MPDTSIWDTLFGKKKPATPAPAPESPTPRWKLDVVLGQAGDAAAGEKPKPEQKSILDSIIEKFTGKTESDRVKQLQKLQR